MTTDLSAVEAALDYHFADPDLLQRALTHGSHLGEAGLARLPGSDNEQLEFLGDAVLGLIVSEHVFRSCPDLDEGHLSNVKHRLVNRAHLADVARSLALGSRLILGKAEEKSGGREKTSILANAFEALLGAVYMDGGVDPARRLILNRVVGAANLRELAAMYVNNVKTTLETVVRSRGLSKPEYVVRSESTGFPQSFVAELRVGNDYISTGRGSSKKNAEMAAARDMLSLLEVDDR